jgi:hypothetical protein
LVKIALNIEKLVFRPMEITVGVGSHGFQAFYAFPDQVCRSNISEIILINFTNKYIYRSR